MPIPTPEKKEKEKDFIKRCMEDLVMNKEYPDVKQRLAVCYASWKKKDVKKSMTYKAAEIGAEKETYWVWASKKTVDQDGDLILPHAFKNIEEYINEYPRIFYNHAWKNWQNQEETLPIGKALRYDLTEEGLKIEFEFAPTDFAQKVKLLVDNGYPMFASVGGYVKESIPVYDDTIKKQIRLIENFELIEVSIVPVPANNNATFIKSLETKSLEAGLKTQIIEALNCIKQPARAQAGRTGWTKSKALNLINLYQKGDRK